MIGVCALPDKRCIMAGMSKPQAFGPLAVFPSTRPWPLHDAAASKRIEAAALAACAPHELMQRAGLSVARLAMAVLPGASSAWVVAGPGNNGGDGLVAAAHLHALGWQARVTLLADVARMPPDARRALDCAQAAGVDIQWGWSGEQASSDITIDALLGLGSTRPPVGDMEQAILCMNKQAAPVLSVDLPSGLNVDTGATFGGEVVRADHTLALLTLKPGLFTGVARDQVGRVWLDDLGMAQAWSEPTARLVGPPERTVRLHQQHKGSFGDVLVLGGAPGMAGAAQLAATAALAAGAGRVYLGAPGMIGLQAIPQRPELMLRHTADLMIEAALSASTVVCGCGGGAWVEEVLPPVLRWAARLVLDADGLNAVAADPSLRRALQRRHSLGLPTVLTPHPLEAARLLGIGAANVQSDRIQRACDLADLFACTVVLKGSGTVIASPGQIPSINPTGNARLGSAGTGDVLAGWLGGVWAQRPSDNGRSAAAATVWRHGRAADNVRFDGPLLAADLIDAMPGSLVSVD